MPGYSDLDNQVLSGRPSAVFRRGGLRGLAAIPRGYVAIDDQVINAKPRTAVRNLNGLGAGYSALDDQVLHGQPRKRTRNLGQIDPSDDGSIIPSPSIDSLGFPLDWPTVTLSDSSNDPLTQSVLANINSDVSSFNLTSFLNTLTTNAAKVATVAELPAGSTIFPNGVITAGGVNLGNTGSILPLLLLAGGALLLFSVLGGHR